MIIFSLIYKAYEEKTKKAFYDYKPKQIKDNSMEKKIEECKIKKRTLDSVSIKCREMSNNGEVTYFSIEDIDRIINDLKRDL